MIEHYNYARTKLNVGDEIIVKYKGRNTSYNAATLKRLEGWTVGQIYKGIVVERVEGKGIVDLYKIKTNKLECSHHLYNIELYIETGVLELQKISKQLSLF